MATELTVTTDLRFPKCIPDAYNVMLYFGTLNLGTYEADGMDASDVADLFMHLLHFSIMSKDGYTFDYGTTSKLVKAYVAGLEVVAGTDLSTTPGEVQFLAIGFRT